MLDMLWIGERKREVQLQLIPANIIQAPDS